MSDSPSGTLLYVVVETYPLTQVGYDDDHGPEFDLDSEYDALEPPLLAALSAIAARFDEDTCTTPDCKSTVGGWLDDDDDLPRAGGRWAWVTVVVDTAEPDKHRFLCEDCTTVLLG